MWGILDTVANVGTFGLLPMVTGSDSPVSDFFGVTQTEATKEINEIRQKQADLQADRQRRAIARQAVVQQQSLRAQQAVSGASSAGLLGQQQIAGGVAREIGFIDETQRLGKEITALSGEIADANQTQAMIGMGIDIASAFVDPTKIAENLTGISPGGGANQVFQPTTPQGTGLVDTGTVVSRSGAVMSPAIPQGNQVSLSSGNTASATPSNKRIITI